MRACEQPALGWTLVMRRRVSAWWTGGCKAATRTCSELICCDCGDHPDLDYREVSPELQRIRGPYPIAVGVAAYEEHLDLPQPARAGAGDRPR